MGRTKLTSSIKALQEAIGPICIQQSKTQSFREELYTSFNSVYDTPSSSSSASSSSLDLIKQTPSDVLQPTRPDQIEEDSFSSSTTSCCSAKAESKETESVPNGPISSNRFFFSPCTSKSIMEETKPEMGLVKIASLSDPKLETGEGVVGFFEESVAMAMVSEDPYRDFRNSMEEMVEAHGLREWSRLQELLHCFLRLNEKKTHKIIVLAFVDLLMQLMSEDKDGLYSSFPSSCLNVYDLDQ